jgi:hypothetical protein
MKYITLISVRAIPLKHTDCDTSHPQTVCESEFSGGHLESQEWPPFGRASRFLGCPDHLDKIARHASSAE